MSSHLVGSLKSFLKSKHSHVQSTSATTMSETDPKSLANFIKEVHKKLRHNFKQTQDADEVWLKHCQDATTLRKYAQSMYNLADSHWELLTNSSPETSRILWVKNAIILYYFEGEIQSARTREAAVGFLPHYEYKTTEFLQPLRVLDVGSCYNPFSKFSEFNVTALDLAPAVESVLECDFLNVRLGTELVLNSSVKTVECLPACSFDAVIFSLLLEYLPSPEQRLTCCMKAHDALQYEGLLLIVTPDSKHATANAQVMKSWRVALEGLGFRRVRYEKLRHVHCMGFRKIAPLHSDVNLSQLSTMLCIPQDWNEQNYHRDSDGEQLVRTEEEADDVACKFSELPMNVCIADE